MNEVPTVRVVVVDDHPAVREGLSAILEAEMGIRVVWVADSGRGGVTLAATEQPDVVLMDLQMPDMGGIAATGDIVKDSPHVAVLVVTMFEDDANVFAAMRAGARGYLLKGASRQEIVRGVRAVAGGEAIFGAGIARRILAQFDKAEPPAPTGSPAFPELTTREREILDLIAAGLNNSEITRELVLSPKTVRNHISNVFAKLQVADRAQAIVRARDAGLGQRSR
jgi:DNA-binding NarL/FixJ family response regulator